MQIQPVNSFYTPSYLAYAVFAAHFSGQSSIPEIRKIERFIEVEARDVRINAVEPAKENTLYYKTGKFLDLDKTGERLDLRAWNN